MLAPLPLHNATQLTVPQTTVRRPLATHEPDREVLDQAIILGQSPSPTPTPASAPASPKEPDRSAAHTQKVLTAVLGPGFTAQRYQDSLKDSLPGALPLVQISGGDNPGQPPWVSCGVDWRDSQGEQVASSSMFWSRGSDGALNLQWRDIWLDPERRSHGFLERMALSQIETLRQQSQHPETRLELMAGGSGKIGQSQQEIVGKYLWARLGLFEFANDANRDRMATAFAGWIREKAKDHPALTPAILDGLEASSKNWNRPEQYAEFDIPFVKIPVQRGDGRTRLVSLGKAFLLDPKTPGWHGTCRVNQVEPQAWDRVQAALSFGGRKQADSELVPPSPDKVESTLCQQAADLQRPAKERMKHAASLAALRGGVDPQELAQQFSDLGSPDQIQACWKATPAELPPYDRLNKTVSEAMEAAFTRLVQQVESELGQKLDPQWARQVRVAHYGDLAQMGVILRQEAAQHTLAG